MSLAEAVRVEDEAGYVKRAIGEAENREEAVALLCAWAEKDIGLRDALVQRYRPQILYAVCIEAIRSEASGIRQTATHAAAQAAEMARIEDHDASLSDWTMTLVKKFDQWLLPNGAKLKRATLADLRAAEADHKEQKLAHAVKQRFYGNVCAAMTEAGATGTTTVEELLSNLALSKALVDAQR